MNEFLIPVEWAEYGTICVEANTIDEAIEIAKDKKGEIPLPTENFYIDGSWKVNDDVALIKILNKGEI